MPLKVLVTTDKPRREIGQVFTIPPDAQLLGALPVSFCLVGDKYINVSITKTAGGF